MFETSTWTVRNRRNFAVVERIYEQLGLPVITKDWDLADQNQFIGALVHRVGGSLLYGSVIAANARRKKPASVSKRRERASWKSIDPAAGARASVFLTLGAAAMVSPRIEEGIDAVPIDYARLAVIEAFAPPEEDIANVERVFRAVVAEREDPLTKEAAARGGTAAIEAVNTGQAILSFEALKIAGADPASAPMYQPVAGVAQADWYQIASFEWMTFQSVGRLSLYWKDAKERFLDLAFTPFTESPGK